MITLTRADLDAWRPLVPPLASLPSPPRGIVFHWTGGTYRPNEDFDRRSYHLLATGPDGWIEPGRYPIAANMAPRSTPYAAHTGDFNTGRIGLSWCGMAKSDVGRGVMGPYPITEVQLHRGLAFSAFLAHEMRLDVNNPAHACTHREVWEIHGVKGTQNHQKPDWIVLPPYPYVKGWKACGEWMRRVAGEYAAQVRALTATVDMTPIRTWAVVASGAVNARREPNTSRSPVRVIPQGERIIVDAVAEGQNVSGNATWYHTVDGLWVWAGGTDQPAPPRAA